MTVFQRDAGLFFHPDNLIYIELGHGKPEYMTLSKRQRGIQFDNALVLAER